MAEVSRAEGMRRLLELADILDAAPEKRPDGRRRYNQEYYIHPCGTPACALGHWAASRPERWRFVHAFPFLRESDHGEVPVVDWYDCSQQDAELDFAITPREAHELFDGDGCCEAQTAHEAAAYIRAFVARQEAA